MRSYVELFKLFLKQHCQVSSEKHKIGLDHLHITLLVHIFNESAKSLHKLNAGHAWHLLVKYANLYRLDLDCPLLTLKSIVDDLLGCIECFQPIKAEHASFALS